MTQSHDDKPAKLTTDFGAPVPDNQNSLTAGPRGPLLAQDREGHPLRRLRST